MVLPTAVSSRGEGEIWQLEATGGSGTYTWDTEDPSVAAVKSNAFIRSNVEGTTFLEVRDHKNPKNSAKIQVDVAPVARLEWLESKAELPKNDGRALLHAIARDRQGRKFTNCSGLPLHIELGGVDASVVGRVDDWTVLKEYVTSNEQAISLKDRFERQQDALVESQLRPVAAQDWKLLSHNAFGICEQVIIGSDSPVDGLAKVQASLDIGASIHAVESEKAEVVVFDALKSISPNYEDFLLKYHSKDQEGQEFWTFAEFIPKVTAGYSRRVNVAHGSHATVTLEGGSNFWESLHAKYDTSWEIEPANGGLQLSTKTVNFTQSEVDIYCGQPAKPATDLLAQ